MNERERDLLRWCRGELHQAGLITDDEFTEMLQWGSNGPGGGSPSARRLEDYDDLRAKLDKTEKANELVMDALLGIEHQTPIGRCLDEKCWPCSMWGIAHKVLEAIGELAKLPEGVALVSKTKNLTLLSAQAEATQKYLLALSSGFIDGAMDEVLLKDIMKSINSRLPETSILKWELGVGFILVIGAANKPSSSTPTLPTRHPTLFR